MSETRIANTLSVEILEKEYRVSCPPGAEEALENTARQLDKKMNEIRSAGKVFGHERIAVMAALNLTHELISQSQSAESGTSEINAMINKIDQALK